MARAHAGDLGVDPNLAEEILTSLIRASLTHQERSRVMAQAAGDGRRALIIGGGGKMGGWFVRQDKCNISHLGVYRDI